MIQLGVSYKSIVKFVNFFKTIKINLLNSIMLMVEIVQL